MLRRLEAYDARKPVIDGLEYHEGLNAVLISGGVATNVLPDECVVTVNYRFAPDRSEAEALAFVQGVLRRLRGRGHRLRAGRAARARRTRGQGVRRGRRRHGRTRSSAGPTSPGSPALGVPAVNYGPGDPMLAHKQEEFVPIEQLRSCEATLRTLARGPTR